MRPEISRSHSGSYIRSGLAEERMTSNVIVVVVKDSVDRMMKDNTNENSPNGFVKVNVTQNVIDSEQTSL